MNAQADVDKRLAALEAREAEDFAHLFPPVVGAVAPTDDRFAHLFPPEPGR